MPTIDLPNGTVNYRVAGPEDSAAPPVVFVHGFLVDGTLWTQRPPPAWPSSGIRSYAPDWPLGSHPIALHEDADQSPARGSPGTIVAFLEAMDLDDVTLVGNDTGGAICQFLIDTDASRIGRLVLTNCDAFENFPPAPFDTLFKSFRRAARHPCADGADAGHGRPPLTAGYGMLARRVRCRPDARVGGALPERRRRAPRHRRVRPRGGPGRSAGRGRPGWAGSTARCCWSGATATASSRSTSPAACVTCSPTRGWWRSRTARRSCRSSTRAGSPRRSPRFSPVTA